MEWSYFIWRTGLGACRSRGGPIHMAYDASCLLNWHPLIHASRAGQPAKYVHVMRRGPIYRAHQCMPVLNPCVLPGKDGTLKRIVILSKAKDLRVHQITPILHHIVEMLS